MDNKNKLESINFKDKLKSSYYLEKKTEEKIVEIYINRMRQGTRPRKSSIVDEAIALLYTTEFNK